MNFPKVVLTGAVFLFGLIGCIGLVKKAIHSVRYHRYQDKASRVDQKMGLSTLVDIGGKFPQINRVQMLFSKDSQLPIVKTVAYKSDVPWLKGRPAWISDYAAHFGTSSHFIARSLNGKMQYDPPTIQEGDKFNLFDEKLPIQFFLVTDLRLCQMGLYYFEAISGERVFLKSYPVTLGRKDKNGQTLTPKGSFPLGKNVGIYKKGEMGYHLGRKVEMLQVFGTRWMPLIGASKIGIQGSPLIEGKELLEAGYMTDGCIKMRRFDIEELFAIVSSRPTTVTIVDDFRLARLPGRETAEPKR